MQCSVPPLGSPVFVFQYSYVNLCPFDRHLHSFPSQRFSKSEGHVVDPSPLFSGFRRLFWSINASIFDELFRPSAWQLHFSNSRKPSHQLVFGKRLAWSRKSFVLLHQKVLPGRPLCPHSIFLRHTMSCWEHLEQINIFDLFQGTRIQSNYPKQPLQLPPQDRFLHSDFRLQFSQPRPTIFRCYMNQ